MATQVLVQLAQEPKLVDLPGSQLLVPDVDLVDLEAPFVQVDLVPQVDLIPEVDLVPDFRQHFGPQLEDVQPVVLLHDQKHQLVHLVLELLFHH